MTLSFNEELEQMYTAAVDAMTSASVDFDPTELRKLLTEQLSRARGVEVEPENVEPEIVEPETPLTLEAAPPPPTEAYWYEPPEDTEFMEFWVKARRTGHLEGELIITGHSGQGKTMGVIKTCEKMAVPLNIINCSSITTEEKWIGHKEVDHTGTHIVMSEFLRMVEAKGPDTKYPDGMPGYEPGVLLLDELSRLHPRFHNMLFPLLDGQMRVFVPDLHTYIYRHPQVAFIATANIGGKYSGTHQLDAALRERFPYTIERGFPPVDEEVRVLTTATGVDEAKAKKMVEIANKTRAKLENAEIGSAISTRTLVHAARLVAKGASLVRAFELTVIPNYSKDGGGSSERDIVANIIKGKGA